ncbi:Recombination protein N [Tritonibacter multivorans]|uniref:DNA repair protein RecN n=1 Tax=Tritonibacter multivorans TaxID=928856 RepID=A0A0P1GXN1_9RHOB|nr:DNA repair protein RecN [Tritonibacter multivorans]MDA7421041.1 DNA repair protein RecN [Tritonibacter multivorans]CUH80295.1 Recombination protein N [Tritonibacter multivorans]SFC77468.1 DNA replication and repair protein RecN [Tritonibacter multivorans]
MLRALDIRDLLIIDHLELSFQSGLNVLTGETGAGKSILLDSLGFVLGWRGRADLVRQGAAQGEVVAEFDLPEGHAAHAILAEAGLPGGDTLILRRVNTAEGRKTAWVNDRRCSGDVLRALSDTLLELHGQHDDRGLLNPRGHRAMLDAFAGAEPELAKTRSTWAAMASARKDVSAIREALEAVRAEEGFLRHAVRELDDLNPEHGEDEALDSRRRHMQAAERIRGDIARAHGLLTEGAEQAMGEAQRWLEAVAGDAAEGLDAPLAALSRAMIELGEAQEGVETFLSALDYNPLDLEACEERLFAIRALARKHDRQPDELAGYAEFLREKLAALDAGDQSLAEKELALKEAEAAYAKAAEALRAKRCKSAAALDQAVMAELAPLKMERAVFETLVSEGDAGPDGTDAVAFTVATNPGAPAGPLNKIASGGELSRFLLALKVCLRGDDTAKTLIFDEIDRGVGGATADAVGRRLKSLADGSQVLVVTHSPQVAAQGAHHWRVQKSVEAGVTLSRVVPLAEGDRVDEIARMVSGDRITPEARAAAKSLLLAE